MLLRATVRHLLINAGVVPYLYKAGFAVFKARPRPASALSGPAQAFEEGIIKSAWLPLALRRDEEMIAWAGASLAELPLFVIDEIHSILAGTFRSATHYPKRNSFSRK